jgi:hypothetical protein
MQARERGWISLKELLEHLAMLGSLPGAIVSVREVAQRCCEANGTDVHRPLYRLTVSDDELRACFAEALLGGGRQR